MSPLLRLCLTILVLSPLTLNKSANATSLSKALDKSIKQSLVTFHTPGMAVAVVHKGKVIYAKGHGIADIASNTKVNADTYFRLASTSKAFTAAGLAILVEQGKLAWDDPVIDHLPQFRLQDPWATREFTVRELLTHNSGLSGGAGDIMIWPEPSGFSREEVIVNLRHLTPRYGFRNGYGYSNVMYITAGELSAKVAEQSFEACIDRNLFSALNMPCFAGDMPKNLLSKAATPYSYDDERGIFPVPRNAISGEALMSAAAGGMVCNLNGMTQWLQALLDPSQLPFSQDTRDELWQANTILGVSELDEEWDGMLFKSYGLGWRIANMHAHRVISHTGTLSGYQAYVALVPDLDLGVVILNNGANYGARGAVMRTALTHFIPEAQIKPNNDWVAAYVAYQAEREEAYLARNIQPPLADISRQPIPKESLVGTYQDKWFGQLHIRSKQDGSGLEIASDVMKTLIGSLEAFDATRYVARWYNKEAEAPLFVEFTLSPEQEVLGLRLAPFSNRVREQHSYSDLHFKKLQTNSELD